MAICVLLDKMLRKVFSEEETLDQGSEVEVRRP